MLILRDGIRGLAYAQSGAATNLADPSGDLASCPRELAASSVDSNPSPDRGGPP